MSRLYLAQWYEDEACRLKHEKVFRDRTEAEECVTYLRALPAGEVYRITLKTERPRKER